MPPKVLTQHHSPEASDTPNATSVSRRAVQSRWQCANYATKLLQDHRIQQISGRDSVSTERAWLESRRPPRTLAEWVKMEETRDFLTPRFVLQFTYINLAFSPAPDDTVSNLYKVWIVVLPFSTHIFTTFSPVVLHRWSSNSKLQVSFSTRITHVSWAKTRRSTTAAWG